MPIITWSCCSKLPSSLHGHWLCRWDL